MNKKYWWAAIVMLLVLAGIGYYTYVYWQEGTPEYSFKEMQLAYKDHDTNEFDRYFNTDSVFNNVWPRLVAIDSGYILKDNTESALEQQINIDEVESHATTTQAALENEVYDKVLGKADVDANNSAEYARGFLTDVLGSTSTFTIQDGVASMNVVYENYAVQNAQNYPVYDFKIIMTQQKDRHWEVTDIQGLEDDYVGEVSDLQRIDDMSTIGALVNKYLTAGQQPLLDNANWRSELSSYALSQDQTTSLPEDPLASYSDSNKYAFAISNADSSTTYEYVIRAKLSTISSSAFQGQYFADLSYTDAIKKLSGGNNILLGIDCNAPAYCYLGWGNDTDWSKSFNQSSAATTQ